VRVWNKKRGRCAGVPAQDAQPAQVRAAVGRFCVFVVSVWVVRFWNEQEGDGVSFLAQGNKCSRDDRCRQ